MSGTALDGINAALEGVQTTAEAYLFDEYHVSESAQPYVVDDYDGSETGEPYHVGDDNVSPSPNLELSYEDHGNSYSSAEPCKHVTISPSAAVSPTASPTPTPTTSVTASATPTRTPSTSPSPTTTPSVSPSPSPKFATLHYAADNEAFVYVNGVLVSALTDWRLFETISFPLRRNDVVAILANDKGGWYGLIAALYVGDRWFVTGRDEWKAIKAFEFPGDDELWTVRFFDTCSWDLVEARPNADVIFNGKAPDFPYETGAQYVWADDAGENDSIFVRFVLGGEDCS
ncbi:cell surface glycoprotein [Gracilaria domingensis]|nr:cell surface glycoprotein [Gracilaria domingensis]